jgi:hypothetical protein
MSAPIDEPVFLVGCPRSGTTLLQQMLNTHPAVAIAPETHFIRRFWLQRRNYGELTIDSNYHGLIDDIVRMPEFSEMELNADDYRTTAMSEPREYSTLFRLLLEQLAHRRGAAVIGEKTPNHLLYMPTLSDFFPRALFVHIVRDPRAVMNSWRNVPWSTGSLVSDAMVWRRYMAMARRRPPHNRARLLVVRYEGLVTDPEQTLRTVCRFIHVDFESAMLSFHQRASSRVNVLREPWKAGATGPIDSRRVQGWRQELNDAMVAQIEAVVRLEMRRLEYEPQTPAARLLPLAARVWGRRLWWRAKRWAAAMVR